MRFPSPSDDIDRIRQFLRPKISDNRPAISWMLVLAVRKLAPTHEIEVPS